MNGRLFIPAATLRRWCDKNNAHYDSMLKELRYNRVLVKWDRYMTLAAGTNYPHSRLMCWEIDMLKPEISGLLTLIRSDEKEEDKSLASNS